MLRVTCTHCDFTFVHVHTANHGTVVLHVYGTTTLLHFLLHFSFPLNHIKNQSLTSIQMLSRCEVWGNLSRIKKTATNISHIGKEQEEVSHKPTCPQVATQWVLNCYHRRTTLQRHGPKRPGYTIHSKWTISFSTVYGYQPRWLIF